MRAKTTTIRVNGETWKVPRGFGKEYLRVVDDDTFELGRPGKVLSVVRDLLLLVGYDASVEVTADWSLRKLVEAEVYAANVHLRASDNAIRRHPKPRWLPEPWRGVRGIANMADNPMPTVLR